MTDEELKAAFAERLRIDPEDIAYSHDLSEKLAHFRAGHAAAPPKWLPIEQAPKDQMIIGLCEWRGVVSPMKWATQENHRNPRPYWSSIGDSVWGMQRIRSDQPTHYMLCNDFTPPAPPEQSA